MKQKWLICILICAACAAMTAAAKAETGRLTTAFAEDVPCPTHIPMVKTQRLSLDKTLVRNALEKSRLPSRPDETWTLQVGACDNPDCALLFKEQNGAAGGIACDYAGAPSRGQGERYDRASVTVRAFLDEIGLTEYEYPFYFCNDAYHAWYGSPAHPITADDYRAAHPDFAEKKWARTGGSPILVVVRFQMDSLPFGSSVSWTTHTDPAGNGNPTPSAFFLVTENGEIGEAYIRNPVKATGESGSGADVLPWQTVWEKNRESIEETFLTGAHEEDRMTLQYVELLLLTDDGGMTFPAWNFVFESFTGNECCERYGGELPEPCRMTQLGLAYHAVTGEQVW